MVRASISSGIDAACAAVVPGGDTGALRGPSASLPEFVICIGAIDARRDVNRAANPTISKLRSISVENPLASSVAAGTPVSPASSNISSARRH